MWDMRKHQIVWKPCCRVPGKHYMSPLSQLCSPREDCRTCSLTCHHSHSLILLSSIISPKKSYVLLFEIFLLLWQLFMSYFFYRTLNMCKCNDVFYFVINLSMGAYFCTFLHIVLFFCKLENDLYWNPCLKLKSQACVGNFFKSLSTERPCLHHTIFIVDAPVGEQRTNRAKTTWEGIKWSERNKNSSRGYFIKSLPALGNSQRSWKLKKDIWLEGQKAQWVSAMSLGRTPVWPAHSSCPWTFSLCFIGAGFGPALCWGCLCCHKGTGWPWYAP